MLIESAENIQQNELRMSGKSIKGKGCDIQQDKIVEAEKAGFCCVMDGVGSGRHSNLVTNRLANLFDIFNFQALPINLDDARSRIVKLLDAAQQLTKNTQEETRDVHKDPKYFYNDTTIVGFQAYKTTGKQKEGIVFWQGDSGAVVVRADGKVEKLTTEDKEEDPETKRYHVNNTVGIGKQINIVPITLAEGDKLVLYSDGLTDDEYEKYFGIKDIAEIVTSANGSLRKVAARLVGEADIKNPKSDNRSALIVENQFNRPGEQKVREIGDAIQKNRGNIALALITLLNVWFGSGMISERINNANVSSTLDGNGTTQVDKSPTPTKTPIPTRTPGPTRTPTPTNTALPPTSTPAGTQTNSNLPATTVEAASPTATSGRMDILGQDGEVIATYTNKPWSTSTAVPTHTPGPK